MIATADTSFLVSLYAGDVNTAPARAWMVANSVPIRLTDALRFETENALRLGQFRGQISPVDVQRAMTDIESDLALGILIPELIESHLLWAECRRLSAAHTPAMGARAYDITHVAAALLMGADTFLSFDSRQRSFATAAGLIVAP
jgi:predicted nucleic acid-binding protein